jgi:hypothetical protein
MGFRATDSERIEIARRSQWKPASAGPAEQRNPTSGVDSAERVADQRELSSRFFLARLEFLEITLNQQSGRSNNHRVELGDLVEQCLGLTLTSVQIPAITRRNYNSSTATPR